jgi:3-polyprenyl-4-hydroxybenzoate decarboxylase
MHPELKQWLANEASRNARSTSEEAICLLKTARALRESAPRRARNPQAMARILKALQALPVLDARSMDVALYDKTGMPR